MRLPLRVCAALAAGVSLAVGAQSAPPPTPEQVEADWSRQEQLRTPAGAVPYDVAQVVRRGLKLAESQSRLGANTDRAVADLRRIQAEATSNAGRAADQKLYAEARWVVRRMALGNPLLQFESLLFAKKAPTAFPHMSDQHYGWWSRPGGGLFVLQGITGTEPRVKSLTEELPEGSISGLDVAFDGTKILFAWCRFYPGLFAQQNKADKGNVPEDAFYHIFEMNADGSGLRQITRGRYDDFDARYLPDGTIVFLSTRKGSVLQTSRAYSESTRGSDRPDSYVRCGGDNWRPVPVFTLHAMAPDGTDLRPISAFENFEWAPSVANDGRVLFTRWDYIDRFNGHFFSLWSANQDGTNPQLVYGNYTVKPQVVIEARSIPGSSKLVFTAAAHHSITGGSICLLDRTLGLEELAPVTRLTPEVCFPETEGWPEHYYANPWPLSEEYFLVAWAHAKLPPHKFVTDASNPTNATGIYLLDVFGNQELLYRDPSLSSMFPMPLAQRERPPVQAHTVNWERAAEGSFLVQDVYRGLDGIPRGTVKQLRIVAVPPKVQPHMNTPSIGVSAEDPGKYVLGHAPVEGDGSAHVRVPSGVPVFFQALDERGLAIQTMRSLTYVLPGQTLSCVGCHEHREVAPPLEAAPVAALRAPSKLAPAPEGAWPLDFDVLVMPVLERNCVRCHKSGGEDQRAEKLNLSSPGAFEALLSFGGEDLKKLVFERDRSIPGQMPAANSKLWRLVTGAEGAHRELKLQPEALQRLALWMDTYAQRQGHFSADQQQELVELKRQYWFLFEK
jgi:hypothetical protein